MNDKGKCPPSNSEVMADYLGKNQNTKIWAKVPVKCVIELYLYKLLPGCDNFHDGLVCWPQTPSGHQAQVDCLNNVAFAQALKQSSGSENIGETKQYISSII